MKSEVENILNDNSLKDLLRKIIQNALEKFYQKSKTETPYAFGFFTSSDYGYLEITGNTIEGLENKITEYSELDSFEDKTKEELKNELKWSPCDWQYHCEYDINELLIFEDLYLAKIDVLKCDVFDKYDEDKAEEFIETEITKPLNKILIEVLKELNIENHLNVKNITLGVWKGDQSDEERIEFVTKINSKNLSDVFVTEIELE